MIKYIYTFSFIFFLIAMIAPYKKGGIDFIKPTIHTEVEAFQNKDLVEPLNKAYKDPRNINFVDSATINLGAPIINAESAVVISVNSKEILYEKNSEIHKPVASLSKIMTGILVSEYLPIEKKVKVSKNAASIGENTMGLIEGENFSVEELLYGLILNSGNDAAFALAEAVAGSEENFVLMMNDKAKLLGANNTVFADSSGLNIKRKTFYSTAVDMAKIAYYSQTTHMKLKEIYNTFTHEIPNTEEHGYKYLENQTNLLTTYPGVKGMKTGYTSEAGLCLVTYAENNGEEVIVVILNSTDRRGDAILLLDYAFNKLNVNVEHDLL